MRSADILSGRAVVILVLFGAAAWDTGLINPAQAQTSFRRPLCFPRGPAATRDAPASPEAGEGVSDETAETPSDETGGAGASDFAALDTTPSSPTSLAPNMLGDSCSCSGSGLAFSDSYGTVPVSGGLSVGRFKVAENTNPLPQDRVFFNYNHFENAYSVSTFFPQQRVRDVNVDRYTLGGEKTFHDGASSVELRIPFAATLRNDLNVARLDDVEGVEFGDIALNFKRVLYRQSRCAIAAGLGLTLPTGPDAKMTLVNDELTVNEDAVHLLPYVGLLLTPSERLFTQFFAQFDFDANGNRVSFNGEDVGAFQEQTLLFLDWSVGYWLYRRCCPDCDGVAHEGLVGVAPILELHYTSTLSQTDRVSTDGGTLANLSGRQDLLNLTGGLEAQFGGNWFVRAAGVVPLKENPDRRFDAEFLFQINRLF